MAGVENALYVGGLNQANPEAADFISQGDNHLRLLKACLLNTFPGFSRPIDGALFPWAQTPGSISVYAKFIEQTGRIGALEAFISPTHPSGALLRANNNLSDVQNPATARANLGIPALTDVLLRSQNLADLADVAAARANLGVTASGDVLLKAQNLSDIPDPNLARAALSVPALADVLLKGQNLADLTDAAAARSNLGVSSTLEILLKNQNLADVPDKGAARANLGVSSTAEMSAAIAAALGTAGTVTSVNGQTGDVTIVLPVNQYTDLTEFPVTGQEGRLYIDGTTGITYRWNGSAYSVLQSELFGVADGVATLAADGKHTETEIRRYNYANTAAFPASGVAGAIYIAEDTGKLYRWVSTGVYAELAPSPDEVQQYANLAAFPATGEAATLYIAADTGLVYRWNGSAYAATGLQPIADKTILGNVSGATATPVALTQAQVRALVRWPRELDTGAAPTTANSLDAATDSYVHGDNIALNSGRKWYVVNSDNVAMAASYNNGTNARVTVVGSTGMTFRAVADSAFLHCTTLTFGTQHTGGSNPSSKNFLFNVAGTITGEFSGAPPVNTFIGMNATNITYTGKSNSGNTTILHSNTITFTSSGRHNWVQSSNDVTISGSAERNTVYNTTLTCSVTGSGNTIWSGRGTVSGNGNFLHQLYNGTISGSNNFGFRVNNVSGSHNFLFGANSSYTLSATGSKNVAFGVEKCSINGSGNLILPGGRDGNPAPVAITESYSVLREVALATTDVNVVKHARTVDPVMWAATTDATATRMKVPGSSADSGITLDRDTASGEHYLGYIEAEVNASLNASPTNADHLIGKYRWTFNNSTLSAATVVHTVSGGTGNTWVVDGEIVGGVFYIKVTGEAGKSLTWAARVTSLSTYTN